MAQLSVKEVLKPFNKGEMIGKERYHMLIKKIENKETFGIIFKDSKNLYDIGCQASVDKVIKKYPNGEYDILVKGLTRFKVKNTFFKEKIIEIIR